MHVEVMHIKPSKLHACRLSYSCLYVFMLLLFNECERAMISETVAAMRRDIYE